MEPFTIPHAAWLALTFIFATFCTAMGRLPAGSDAHGRLRIALIVLVTFNETAWTLYRHVVVGIPLVENLPLHLCDLAVILLLAGLITRRTRLAELSYFVGVPGALLAIIFPAVSETGAIRTIAELRYFTTHIAIVAGGFYLTYGRQQYPQVRAAFRALIFVHVYAILITPVNLMIGTNYFFTLSAPAEIGWVARQPHGVFLGGVSAIFLITFLLMSQLSRALGSARQQS